MKTLALIAICCASASAMATQEKTYTCRFEENIPYGVAMWHNSERVKNGVGKESRFEPYGSQEAKALTTDALVDRGAGEGEAPTQTQPRETAFYQAYDEKGWYIYIESKEPLASELVNKLIDPLSPGHKEGYELFFMPGMKEVPYYQALIRSYGNQVTYFDWNMPHSEYRSLKEGTRVESLPLEGGVGTFVFIPWNLLYEHAPVNGGEWRFTLIRWMPFSKASAVTWGGQVHETGRFGRVRFEAPNAGQKLAIEKRLLQTAWFKFQAVSAKLAEYWGDARIGDPAFYEAKLKPEIGRLNALVTKWGDSDSWGEAQVEEGFAMLSELMEFDYKVADLRNVYLRDKRLAGQ